MVEKPNCTHSPEMGWRHFLAASFWSCAWSWPGSGGAAKRADDAEAKMGPLLVKANRFEWFRHRVFHVFSVAVLAMSAFYQPAGGAPTGILCGTVVTLT